MTLTVRLLGLELLHIDMSTDSPNAESTDPGDYMASPLPFAGFSPGVRWDADVVEP